MKIIIKYEIIYNNYIYINLINNKNFILQLLSSFSSIWKKKKLVIEINPERRRRQQLWRLQTTEEAIDWDAIVRRRRQQLQRRRPAPDLSSRTDGRPAHHSSCRRSFVTHRTATGSPQQVSQICDRLFDERLTRFNLQFQFFSPSTKVLIFFSFDKRFNKIRQEFFLLLRFFSQSFDLFPIVSRGLFLEEKMYQWNGMGIPLVLGWKAHSTILVEFSFQWNGDSIVF